ncbi:MAG: NADH-quinone oxidoreductase subunit N, partial [Kineosporiaceae bacterium]
MTPLTGVQALDWQAVTPVVAPLAALLAVLLLDAVAPGFARVRRVHDGIAVLGLVVAGAAVVRLAAGGADAVTACVPGGGLEVSACSFAVSPLTLTLQAVAIGAALVCLLLTLDGPGARDRAPHHVLLLAAVAGATALAGARDLATLVVALETATLPVVGLVALRRDPQGAQGAVTFLFTALASLGLLLLGSALILAATGSAHFDRISAALGEPGLPPRVRAVAVLGVLLAVAGIAFKLSAVPFHLWTPDTYAGAPLPIAAFLASVSKAAGVAAVVVLLTVGVLPLAGAWAPVLGLLAAVTFTVGNLVALRERLAVRLLAWSTIAQAGWVLLPLAGAGPAGPAQGRAAAAGAVGYLVAYTAATLAVFAVVVVFARHHPAGEEHAVDAYRGLARREPVAAAVLAFGLACLAGLPPGIVGLVAKVVAVRPVVDVAAWPLALVAAANVALGLVYYLRWAALLFAPAAGPVPTWRVRTAEGLAVGGAGAACVALSVWPQVVAGVV